MYTATLTAAILALAACGRETPATLAASAAPESAAATARLDAPGRSRRATATPDTTRRPPHPDSSAKSPADGRAAWSQGAELFRPLLPQRTAHDSISFASAVKVGRADTRWPVKGPAPLPGSLLPGKRIVAFYGNPLSTKMGVLGEYPVDEMLAKLDTEVERWRQADPATPVQPALQLIAVVAQGSPGRDGMYRLRMDSALIEQVYGWAQRRNALLFLDVQVGKSTVQAELPRLMKFLERPNVHLALDPEFSMHYDKEGLAPGKKIGTMDATDVNYAIRALSQLARDQHLPPKVLVVHRFTRKMLRNASAIRLDPNVQVVIDMDGWGPPWLKFDSYRDYERAEPVQYTGFKLFFHNDVKKGDPLLTPREVLALFPRPLYIQYQ